jgi:hypothetical protein
MELTSHRISHLLKQLIFRNNQQELRNSKYKRRDQERTDLLLRTGDMPTEPIDLSEDALLHQFMNDRPR